MSETQNAGRVSEESAYLIRKGGAWYRPDSAGYTNNAHEAGLYTLEEADKITHPNGPRGPRDGMSYHHRDTVPALALRAADHPAVVVRVKPLEWKETGPGSAHMWASTVAGKYTINVYAGMRHAFQLNRNHGPAEYFDTEQEAKAAAESDYRNAILSCIEPLRPATEQAGGEVVAPTGAAIDRAAHALEMGTDLSLPWEDLCTIAQLVLSASPPSPAATQSAVVSGPIHRHVKRGSEYVLLGMGKMQAEDWRDLSGEQVLEDGAEVGKSVDMREVAIYRSIADGSLWVRPREEFEDGRLATLSNPGASQ